jgi:hypothetical protein
VIRGAPEHGSEIFVLNVVSLRTTRRHSLNNKQSSEERNVIQLQKLKLCFPLCQRLWRQLTDTSWRSSDALLYRWRHSFFEPSASLIRKRGFSRVNWGYLYPYLKWTQIHIYIKPAVGKEGTLYEAGRWPIAKRVSHVLSGASYKCTKGGGGEEKQENKSRCNIQK